MTGKSEGRGQAAASGSPDPLRDFRNFMWLAFKAVLGIEPTPLQMDMAEWVWRGPRFRLAMAARGFGKSLITAIYAAWRIYRNHVETGGHPDINIMVVSGAKDRADNFSTFIQELFYRMECLKPLVPSDPRRWSRLSFDVEGAAAQQQPTCASRGIFSRLTGDRATLVIFDDIEIPSNSETQGQRDKLRRRAQEFLDVLKPEGEMVGLGTPQCEDTIYSVLPEWGFETRIWPAEMPSSEWRSTHGHMLSPRIAEKKDPPGSPTEPRRFPLEELAVKKAAGKSRYALQYMLDTSLSDAERYPLKLSDLIVMDLDPEVGPERPVWAGSPDYVRGDLPNVGLTGDAFHRPMTIRDNAFVPYDHIIMGIDPAGRGKDETGVAVVAAIGGYVFLLHSEGLSTGYNDEALARLTELAGLFSVKQAIVESNFGDGMFEALLERAFFSRGLRVAIEPVRHNTQKEARIIDALEPVMNQHRLVVSSNTILGDRPGHGDDGQRYKLYYQMTRLERAKDALSHDDRLEALAIAVKHLTDRMTIDQDKVNQRRLDKESEAEWKDYWEHAVGYPPQRKKGWLTTNRAFAPSASSMPAPVKRPSWSIPT